MAGQHWPFRPFTWVALRCVHSSCLTWLWTAWLPARAWQWKLGIEYKCFLSIEYHHSWVSSFFEELQLMFYLPLNHHSCQLPSVLFQKCMRPLPLLCIKWCSPTHSWAVSFKYSIYAHSAEGSESSIDITLKTRGNSQHVIVSLTWGANVRFQKRQRIQEHTFQIPL